MQHRKFRYSLIAIILLGSIGCDQASKKIASENLKFEAGSSYFFDLFQLIYAENKGAFLSFGEGFSPGIHFVCLIVAPLLVLSSLFFYVIVGNKHTSLELVGFSFVLGGGISNVFDRLTNGYVVDFMLLSWQSLRTGIFNFADVFIFLGIGILIFGAFYKQPGA